MNLPRITRDIVRQKATDASFRRGEEYYADGMVISLVRWNKTLAAEVEGNEPCPYDVRVVFDEAGIVEAECDCPYDFGGWCKHIVAVLVALIKQPDIVDMRSTLELLLADLDRTRLRALILNLVESNPSLLSEIERQIR